MMLWALYMGLAGAVPAGSRSGPGAAAANVFYALWAAGALTL